MNKEELEQAFNETTDNAVNLLKENVKLKNIIKEETYEFYREQTLLLTDENKELKNKYNITRDNFYALAKRINKAIEYIENIKPLSLDETSVKKELKSVYNPEGNIIKGTEIYFNTMCHLEDFEIAIWNLLNILKGEDKE